MSATTPSSSFTAVVNGCDGGAPTAATSGGDDNLNGNAVGRTRGNLHGDSDDGDPNSSVLFGMSTADNDGGGGGGGDGGGDGFGMSMDGAKPDSKNRGDVLPVRRDRHTLSALHNRRQQPSQQHRRGGNGATARSGDISSGRTFSDPCEIAFRSRRLFDAYSGSETRKGGRRNFSPRRVDNTRSTKVMLLSKYPWLTRTR